MESHHKNPKSGSPDQRTSKTSLRIGFGLLAFIVVMAGVLFAVSGLILDRKSSQPADKGDTPSAAEGHVF